MKHNPEDHWEGISETRHKENHTWNMYEEKSQGYQ